MDPYFKLAFNLNFKNLYVYLYAHMPGIQKRVLDTRGLELQAVVSFLTGSSELNWGPLQEQHMVLTTEPSVNPNLLTFINLHHIEVSMCRGQETRKGPARGERGDLAGEGPGEHRTRVIKSVNCLHRGPCFSSQHLRQVAHCCLELQLIRIRHLLASEGTCPHIHKSHTSWHTYANQRA